MNTHRSPAITPQYVGPAAAAAYLSISRTKLYELLRTDLPSFKIGSRTIIRLADLDAWAARQLNDPNERIDPSQG